MRTPTTTTASRMKTYDRIVTGLMLACAAGFVFGALSLTWS